MQMKRSDILDRWTILLMKSRLDPDAARELEGFFLEIPRIILETKEWTTGDSTRFLVAVVGLMEANARIWENEAALRKEEPCLPVPESCENAPPMPSEDFGFSLEADV